MRSQGRSKLEAKTEIFKFPDRILVDTSDYKTNNRPQLKIQLQTLIKQHTKGHAKACLAIELGSGNGAFLNEIAHRNPNSLYTGIELKEERILDAIIEAEERGISNTIIIKVSAELLDEIFLEQQIDTIFMNFPDPWPKKRHIKNRMTSGKFLKKYEKILQKNGEFIFKTDNENMFDYTLEQLENSEVKPVSTDKALKTSEDNIETEYEKRYRRNGKGIFQIVARLDKITLNL